MTVFRRAEHIEHKHDTDQLREWLLTAMNALSDREGLSYRKENCAMMRAHLKALDGELGLSKERIRQLEAAAFTKMRKSLEGAVIRGLAVFIVRFFWRSKHCGLAVAVRSLVRLG